MINLLIADDHLVIIDGIKAMLQEDNSIKIVGEAKNGIEVLQLLEKGINVDILLLDISMPEMDGITVAKEIKRLYPDIKILILTMYLSPEYIDNIIESGVQGYILKNTGKTELKEAITTLMEGSDYFSKEVTDMIVSGLRNRIVKKEIEKVQLTKREIDILNLINKEMTSQEIANILFISVKTVDAHRQNMISKLKVRNTVGLIKYAIQNNLIK